MPAIYTLTLNPGLDRTLTVPSLRDNAVLRATTSRLDWGGKGLNVSRALHALGETNTALGIVGGFTGQMLAQGLHDLGIVTDFIQIAAETRTNTVIQEARSEHYIKVNEAGPTIEPRTLEMLHERVAAHVSMGSYWALCGSLPPGVPPAFYGELIAKIQSRGGIACLDTSGEALRLGIQAAPFLVKPNADEATEVTGIPISDLPSAQRAAAHFFDHGVTLVALSLGERGLLLTTPDSTIHISPPRVTVQTLVGVGDALLAGLIYGLSHKLPLPDVARWGVAAGTAAAMTPGVGVGNREEIARLIAQMG